MQTEQLSGITGPQGLAIWLFAGSLLGLLMCCLYALLNHQVSASLERNNRRRVNSPTVDPSELDKAWFWFRAWQRHRVKYIDSAHYVRERSRLGYLRASARFDCQTVGGVLKPGQGILKDWRAS